MGSSSSSSSSSSSEKKGVRKKKKKKKRRRGAGAGPGAGAGAGGEILDVKYDNKTKKAVSNRRSKKTSTDSTAQFTPGAVATVVEKEENTNRSRTVQKEDGTTYLYDYEYQHVEPATAE